MELKVSFLVTFLLVIGVVFVIASNYATDLNYIYPNETQIYVTNVSNYQYAESLNSTFSDLNENVQTATNPDADFFQRIIAFGSATFLAIPTAVFKLVGVQFASLGLMTGFINEYLVDSIGIDPRIVLAVVVFLSLAALITLLKWIAGRSSGA